MVLMFKRSIIFITLICPTIFVAQTLHHETLGAQGKTTTLESGIVISQSVGQQSISGNYFSGNSKIIQGFQQPFWSKLISSSSSIDTIEISYFPNPINDIINFSFSNLIDGTLDILLFDFSGRVIFDQSKSINQGNLKINLSELPSGAYLISLKNEKIQYYTKIIKK